jgi:hypothetical protein
VFHPVDHLAIELFLNGDVRHRRRRRRAMPVLLAGFNPHHVARPDVLDGAARALDTPETL